MFHVEHHSSRNQKRNISRGYSFFFIIARNSQRCNNFHTRSAEHIYLDKVNRRIREGAKEDERGETGRRGDEERGKRKRKRMRIRIEGRMRGE